MMETTRARYTLEFKQEAVRLVKGGQSIAAAARTLCIVEQTLFNWVMRRAPPTGLAHPIATRQTRRKIQIKIATASQAGGNFPFLGDIHLVGCRVVH